MQLAVLFACHAVTASSLTLLNKRIAVNVRYPWIVVIIQCIGSSLISILVDIPYGTIRPVRLKHLPGALLVSCLFTLCLVSSISGLRRVHVPMAVVGKNLTPIITALLEAFILGTPLRFHALVSLAVGTCGGVVYLQGDANATSEGLTLVLINAVFVAVTAVSEKVVSSRKEQSPRGLGLLRNALSVPFVAAIIYLEEDGVSNAMRALQDLTWETMFCMALTAVFGSLSGTLLFELQTRVSAATTQVAALGYKLATTLLSFLVFPASRNDVGVTALLGYTLSTIGVALYVFLPQRKAAKSEHGE